MASIILFGMGVLLGFIICGFLVGVKEADNRLYELELETLIKKLKEEEEKNDLLKSAFESVYDELTEMKNVNAHI
jgi:uncharacterized membrane protein YciS (DUF1049 family)